MPRNPVKAIKDANAFDDPENLEPGTVVKLPPQAPYMLGSKVPKDLVAPGENLGGGGAPGARGEQITVAVARRPADDPARRIGTLFFNPGGPSDPEVPYVVDKDWYFSPTLRARFDIVGLDYYAYFETDAEYTTDLDTYRRWGKPLMVLEFGCCTFTGVGALVAPTPRDASTDSPVTPRMPSAVMRTAGGIA